MFLATAGHRFRGAIRSWLPILLLGLLGSLPVAARAAPAPVPPKTGDVRMLEAGAELWVTLDYLEVQTFNEGVMEKPGDRVRRSHEAARQEQWKFGQQFETFTYDGKRFGGRWRSADFQAEFFTEYVLVEGELAPDGASVRTMVLTRLRFDRPSTEPPEQRGFSKIVLRFENLLPSPGLGTSVTYRFVPGKSRVAIETAVGDTLSSDYHSQTATTWKGLAPHTGRNDVTGQPREIHASVTLETWGRRGPPPAASPRSGPRTVRLSGDSKLAAEIIAWLGSRKGVTIADQTARSAAAIRQERDLAKAGLLEEGSGPSAKAPDVVADADLQMTSIGTDLRDPSTRAVLRVNGSETEVILDVEMARYQKLGDAAFGEWVRLRTAQFIEQVIRTLETNGL